MTQIRKPVNMRAYIDGVDAVGTVKALALPEIQFNQMEQAGLGMAGTAELPTNMAPLEFTLTFLHFPPEFASAMYNPARTAQIILSGQQKIYDGQGEPGVQSLKIALRGRPKTINLGSFEEGNSAEPEITYSCDYAQLAIDQNTQFEIDILTGIKAGSTIVSLFGLIGATF